MSQSIKKQQAIRIRFFSILRDRLGVDELMFAGHEAADVSELKSRLVDRYPTCRALIELSRAAVNAEYVPDSTAVVPGDEVVLITPVSGG